MNEYKRNREMLRKYEDKKITIIGEFRLLNKEINKLTFEKCTMIKPDSVKIEHMNFKKKDFKKIPFELERKTKYILTGKVIEYERKDKTKALKITEIIIKKL